MDIWFSVQHAYIIYVLHINKFPKKKIANTVYLFTYFNFSFFHARHLQFFFFFFVTSINNTLNYSVKFTELFFFFHYDVQTNTSRKDIWQDGDNWWDLLKILLHCDNNNNNHVNNRFRHVVNFYIFCFHAISEAFQFKLSLHMEHHIIFHLNKIKLDYKIVHA